MVQDCVLRFINPFHIKNYNEIKEKNYNDMRLNGWYENSIISGESDLYNYLTDLFLHEKKSSIGSSWSLEKSKYSQNVYATKVKNNYIKWRLIRVGLVVFDTEIGILWYEIKIKTNPWVLDELQEFVYSIKEMARGDNQENYLLFAMPEEKLSQLREDRNIERLEKKRVKCGYIIKGRIKIHFFEDVLKPWLKGIEIDTFFADRKTKEGVLIPDKALFFLWVLNFPETITHLEAVNTVFKLGRGYTKVYTMDEEIGNTDFLRPFNDSIWYACLEGCANYMFPIQEKTFYLHGYVSRLEVYFYLFILCMGQYYSLLQISQDISELQIGRCRVDCTYDFLERLLNKIHTFNLKNNYSQVGHLTQQNEFYKYLKTRFNIERMYNELELKLQLLYRIVEQKRVKKREKMYNFFSFIGSLFVIVESFGNINQIVENFLDKEWDIIIRQNYFSVLLMLIVIAIGILGWGIFYIIKRVLKKIMEW